MKKTKQEIFDIASSSSYSEMQLKFDIFSCKVNVQDLIDIFNVILKKDFAKADNFYSYSYQFRKYDNISYEWKDNKCKYAIDALVKLVDNDDNLKKKVRSLGFIRKLNRIISEIDFTSKGNKADIVYANIMAKLMDFGSRCCKEWLNNKLKEDE